MSDNGAKKRVQDELVHYTEKHTKLSAWLFTDGFYKLSQEQQDLLCIQEAQMRGLMLTLTRRLKIWGDDQNG